MALNYHMFARAIEKSANLVSVRAAQLGAAFAEINANEQETWAVSLSNGASLLNKTVADNAPFSLSWNEAVETQQIYCSLEAALAEPGAPKAGLELKALRVAMSDLRKRAFAANPTGLQPTWAPSCSP